MRQPNGTRMREIVLALATLAVIVAGVWLLWKKTEQKPLAMNSAETTSTLADSGTPFGKGEFASASFDTDGDGLRDWEEKLWGTDANNKDTDGDGATDGEEVASRRDPRKAGPRDSLETPLVITREKEPPPAAYTHPATRLPQPSINVPAPPVELLVETPNNEPLYFFGNAIGALVVEATVDADAELAFWNSAAGATKMNDTLILGFTERAQKYEKLAADIASVVPPKKAEEAHGKLAGAYQNYAKAIRAISNTPVGSYMSGEAIIAYSNAAIELGRAFVGVSDFFYREGIHFGKTAPGNIFMFPR